MSTEVTLAEANELFFAIDRLAREYDQYDFGLPYTSNAGRGHDAIVSMIAAAFNVRDAEIANLRDRVAFLEKMTNRCLENGGDCYGAEVVELRAKLVAAEQRAREYKTACEAKDAALDIKDAEIDYLRKAENGEG